jgi:hypothetical protein
VAQGDFGTKEAELVAMERDGGRGSLGSAMAASREREGEEKEKLATDVA